ncbi:MAG: hypothetical protein AAF530_22505 [Pseudomonadota bacterium]
MSLALTLLHFLGRHAVLALFFGVFVGLALPGLAGHFRPLLSPMVILILMGTLLRIDWSSLLHNLRQPRRALIMFLWLQAAAPALTWLILLPFDLPPALAAGIVLMAAAPPIMSAAAIALMVGLDGPLALVGAMIATLAAPLTVPPMALWLLGLDVQVSAWALMSRLAMVVIIAFTGAAVLRAWIGAPRLAAHANAIDGLIVVGMLVFAVAIMDGVTDTLIARPAVFWGWTLAAFLANPLLQIMGAAVFWRLGGKRALTTALLTGNCNMGLVLAALPPDADPDIGLYFAVAQFPMFMLPAMLVPLYRALLAKFQSQ